MKPLLTAAEQLIGIWHSFITPGLVTATLLALAATEVSADTNCVAPPSGLVSWWQGEGDASDAISTNSGVLINGVTFAAGEVGQAFAFNGTSAYIQVADAPSLRFTTGMTVEAWIYPHVSGGRYCEILSKWEGGVDQRSYAFTVTPSGNAAFAVDSDGGSSSLASAFSVNTVPTNQWTHLAGVYDGASVKLYLNGVLQNTTPWTQGIFPGSAPLIIGSTLVSGSFFDGLIDEPSVYSRALSAAEIQSIYSAGADGKCPPPYPPRIITEPQGQVGYWGGVISFQVKVATTSLPLSYQWYYDGFGISWGTNSTLLLTDLALTSGGHYWVVVSNGLGSATSAPALLVVNPAGISLGLTPTLTITGTVGKTFGIQYTTTVNDTNPWTTLTNFTLTQPVQLWFDTNVNVSSGNYPHRFYRVVAVP